MASFNSLDRHTEAINLNDLKIKGTPFHQQLEEKPPGWQYSKKGNVDFNEKRGFMERTPESVEHLNTRAKSMQKRAQANWGLVSTVVEASDAFRAHGAEREENRSDAPFYNPVSYARQLATGIKPASPRSQQARQTSLNAVDLANAKNSSTMVGHPTAAIFRREKFNREIQIERDNTRKLIEQLKQTPGYYYGNTKDIFWLKQFDAAKARGLEDNEANIEADEKYNVRYPEPVPVPDIKPKSTSKTSLKTTIPPLEFPKEFMESEGHPNYIIGPITLKPMTDPVVLENGISYDRTGITKWLKSHDSDPMTNKKLKSKRMVSNMSLRHALTEYYNLWVLKNNTTGKKKGGRKKKRKKTRKKTRFKKTQNKKRKNKTRKGRNTRKR